MDNTQKFIHDARARGLKDDAIQQLLVDSGWTPTQAMAAVNGLTVPAPPAPADGVHHRVPGHNHKDDGARPSISALAAALQHVLLWLFTGTSTIMLSVVAFSLFGQGTGSSEPLLTYVVLEAVTFVPFLFFFLQYLRQLKREPELATGKVWSIITVVLHSIGTIGAVIGLILAMLLVHNDQSTATIAASAIVGLMDLIVVVAYVLANFAKRPSPQVRFKLLTAFPAVLFVLIAIFGVVALFRVGPLRADDQTRQHLVTAAMSVRDYSRSNNRLPETAPAGLPEGVTYKKQGSDKYLLCADFRIAHKGYSYGQAIEDSYVDTYYFSSNKKGQSCFTLTDYNAQNNASPIQSGICPNSSSLQTVTCEAQ